MGRESWLLILDSLIAGAIEKATMEYYENNSLPVTGKVIKNYVLSPDAYSL